MKFMGYTRSNGTVGVRNHLLILSTVACANNPVRNIAQQLTGAVPITHQNGCGHLPREAERVHRTLVGYGSNPNVGACIVVGLGCEVIQTKKVAEEIAQTGKSVACILIQESGGTINATAEGVRIGREMLSELSKQQREEHDISDLILALECGGSDAASGITANPAIGVASDLLVKQGGTSVLSETQELIGAENLLAERAVNKKVAEDIINIVKRAEQSSLNFGVDIRSTNPGPGNKEGGITTLEEKSIGAAHKGGNAVIQEVVEYAVKPSKKGLIIMDTPGTDVDSVTGILAGGAQVCVFSTGRGTPVGAPIAPVIKIVSNTQTYHSMKETIDINAGKIIDGFCTVQDIGKEIFNEIIEVCNGKMTKAEQLGCGEFAIYRDSPTQ